jgi:predicted metalloendopeptidase
MAIRRSFVARDFPVPSKTQVTRVLRRVQVASKQDRAQLAWMSPATRVQATRKLSLIEEETGCDDRHLRRGYSLPVRGSYLSGATRSS